MSIQSCIVDKSRIARLIEYLFESYSCIAGNISLKFEIRSCADVYECIEHAYMGRYRCGYDRNGAYLWKGFPFTMRQKVVIASNKWTGPNCPRHHDGGHQYFISVRLRLRRLMLLLGWSGSASQHLHVPRKNTYGAIKSCDAVLYFRMTTRKTDALAREAVVFFTPTEIR